jgi:hypothetical protein
MLQAQDLHSWQHQMVRTYAQVMTGSPGAHTSLMLLPLSVHDCAVSLKPQHQGLGRNVMQSSALRVRVRVLLPPSILNIITHKFNHSYHCHDSVNERRNEECIPNQIVIILPHTQPAAAAQPPHESPASKYPAILNPPFASHTFLPHMFPSDYCSRPLPAGIRTDACGGDKVPPPPAPAIGTPLPTGLMDPTPEVGPCCCCASAELAFPGCR